MTSTHLLHADHTVGQQVAVRISRSTDCAPDTALLYRADVEHLYLSSSVKTCKQPEVAHLGCPSDPSLIDRLQVASSLAWLHRSMTGSRQCALKGSDRVAMPCSWRRGDKI